MGNLLSWVPIGRDIYSGEEVKIPIESRGVLTIEGVPGCGKSVFSKNIGVCVSMVRPVIIFDPFGEYFTIKYPNMDNRNYVRGLSNLKIFKNFAFPINRFDRADLSGLGMSDAAVSVLARIIHDPVLRGFHKNDPEKILEIVRDLPFQKATYDKVYRTYTEPLFLTKYGVKMEEMHPGSFVALKFWFEMAVASKMFYCGQEKITNMEDVAQRVRRGCTIFDLGFRGSETGKTKTLLNCGIILKELRPIIEEINPVVIFEEADMLAPSLQASESFVPPPSAAQIHSLCLKLQKLQVFVIAVTQNENLLLRSISDNAHQKILGVLNSNSRNFELVSKLKNDPLTNNRQFVFQRYGKTRVFESYGPFCLDYNHFRAVKNRIMA